MGGSDTTRGIAFQLAVAVRACIQALTDDSVASIRVEGASEIVDIELLDRLGKVISATQVKSRAEPGFWNDAELLRVLRRWFDLDYAPEATFNFVTDASLGKSGVALSDAINAAARGARDPALEHFAEAAGLSDSSLLRRVRIDTRVPGSPDLLNMAEYELIQLRDDGERLGVGEATARISALYKELAIVSGSKHAGDRIVPVERIANILGIDRRDIRATASGGTDDPTIGERPDASRQISSMPRMVGRPDYAQRVFHSLGLEHPQGRGKVALWGPPGFGKTTIAENSYRHLVERGYLARWVNVGADADEREILGRIIRTLDPAARTDEALSSLVLRLRAAARGLDVLICDDLWSAKAAMLIASSVQDSVAVVVTTGTREVADAFEPIEVGRLPDDDVVNVMRLDLPDGGDLRPLVEAIDGWPLLLDLVRRSIRRHIRAGMSPGEAIAEHWHHLTSAGPTAFDRNEWPPRANAIRAALELALAPLVDYERVAARRLGALRTSRPVEISVLATLWLQDVASVRRTTLALDDVALLRYDVAQGRATVHSVLAAGLRSMSSVEQFASVDLEFVDRTGDPHRRTERYIAEHFAEHLVGAGRGGDAISLLVTAAWAATVRRLTGNVFDLGRQAHIVAQRLAATAQTEPTELLTAWIVARTYGTGLGLDRAVAGLFARLHGVGLAEALVQSGGTTSSTAVGHVALAAAMRSEGRMSDAERNVRAALGAAALESAVDLPDTLITVARRLGEVDPAWLRSALEMLEAAVSGSATARAVAAGELLFVDPSTAVVLAQPLIEEVRAFIRGGALPLDLWDFQLEAVLVNILPVIGFRDYDLALEIFEAASAEGFVEAEMLRLGGPLTGLLLAEPTSIPNSKLVRRTVRNQRFDTILERIVRSQALGGRIDAARAVAELAGGSPVRQSRMQSAIGLGMFRTNRPANEVSLQFDLAAEALKKPWHSGQIVAAAVALAEDILPYDPAWAENIARQALARSHVVKGEYDRVLTQARAIAIIAATSVAGVDMVEPRTEQIFLRVAALQPELLPVSRAAAFQSMASDMLAAAIASDNAAIATCVERLRRAGVGGGLAYWHSVSELLARDGSDEWLVRCILRDPEFPTRIAYNSGAVGKIVRRVVYQSGLRAALRLASSFDGLDLQELVAGEAVCHMVSKVGSTRSTKLVLAAIRDAKIGNVAATSVRAIELFAHDEVIAALDELVGVFIQEAVGWSRPIEGRQPRFRLMPDGLHRLIAQKVTPSVLLQWDGILSLDESNRGRIASTLTGVVKFNTAQEVLDWVRWCRLNDIAENDLVRVGLVQVMTSDGRGVAAWLQRSLRLLQVEDVQVARMVFGVLVRGSLPGGARSMLVRESKDWLVRASQEAGGVTDMPMIRLMALVYAGTAEHQAEGVVRSLVAPWMVGSATAMVAAYRNRGGDPLAAELFVRGVVESRAAGTEAIVTVAAADGEAVQEYGVEAVPRLAAAGAFEMWPGGLVGLYLGIGAMAEGLTRSVGASRVLEMLERLHDVSSLAKDLVGGPLETSTTR